MRMRATRRTITLLTRKAPVRRCEIPPDVLRAAAAGGARREPASALVPASGSTFLARAGPGARLRTAAGQTRAPKSTRGVEARLSVHVCRQRPLAATAKPRRYHVELYERSARPQGRGDPLKSIKSATFRRPPRHERRGVHPLRLDRRFAFPDPVRGRGRVERPVRPRRPPEDVLACATLTNSRSARLTDAESRNTSATSRSRSTTLVPAQ